MDILTNEHPEARQIRYLASFLDGKKRERLDTIADVGIRRAAVTLGISYSYLNQNAPWYLKQAYGIMRECVGGDLEALGVRDMIAAKAMWKEERERALQKIFCLEKDLIRAKEQYKKRFGR